MIKTKKNSTQKTKTTKTASNAVAKKTSLNNGQVSNYNCPYARTITIGGEKYVPIGGCSCSDEFTCSERELRDNYTFMSGIGFNGFRSSTQYFDTNSYPHQRPLGFLNTPGIYSHNNSPITMTSGYSETEIEQFEMLENAYYNYWKDKMTFSKRNGNMANLYIVFHAGLTDSYNGAFGCTETSYETNRILGEVITKENIRIYKQTGQKFAFKWKSLLWHLPGHNTVLVYLERLGRDRGLYFDPWIYQYPVIFSTDRFNVLMSSNKVKGKPSFEVFK